MLEIQLRKTEVEGDVRMVTVKSGRTGMIVNKNGFGALPIQRISRAQAGELLVRAFQGGINFFDTVRAYSDSEEKIGAALSAVRDRIFIATKTKALDVNSFWQDLAESLETLKTDYIDIYQFHNPPFYPMPDDGTGLYEAMVEAREKGMMGHIGITNHRIQVAQEAIDSGLYETLQFPFSYLATDPEIQLVNSCKEEGMGFIAMKSLAGGLILNARAAYAFHAQFDHVVAIWGIQRPAELQDFLELSEHPSEMSHDIQELIDKDRQMLSGEFCRGCGYCLPCPSGISIPDCARMSLHDSTRSHHGLF